MIRFAIALILAGVLHSVAQAQAESEPIETRVTREYRECVTDLVKGMDDGEQKPDVIADAAHSLCLGKFNTFTRTIKTSLEAKLRPIKLSEAEKKKMIDDSMSKWTADTKANARNQAIGWVLLQRKNNAQN